jgi:predicted lipid-binding transport protein (Tim44 family)
LRLQAPPRLVPVSDAPHRPQSEETPSAEELDRIAIPASIRRAPRFGRVVGTGIGGGFAVGFLCGMILPNSTGLGRATVGILVGLGIAVFTGLIAGLIAVGLDRRTPAHLKAAKEREAAAAQAVGGESPPPAQPSAQPEERQ